MGNCCSSPDKLDKEPESVYENTTTLVGGSHTKSASLNNKSEVILNHQSNSNIVESNFNNNNQITIDSQLESNNNIPLNQSSKQQPLSTASNPNLTNTVVQSSSMHNSARDQQHPQNDPPTLHKNSPNNQANANGIHSNPNFSNNQNHINSNQNTVNNINPPSIHESGSLIGDSAINVAAGQKRVPFQTLSKEHIDSTRIMEEANSIKGTSQQQEKDERDQLEGILAKNVVKTKEQLQDNETGKYLFLCRSDSAKSFILQIPHVQAQSPNSMRVLFDIAEKYIRFVYGTEAITLELLFGMQDLTKSVLSHSDCFPAYFKTREVFEDSYEIQVNVQRKQVSSNKISKESDGFDFIPLNVFPSMTADDAKKYICNLPQLGFNPNDFAIFRSEQLNQAKLLPMSDEDKFGLYIPDDQFALKNIEDELLQFQPNKPASQDSSEFYWLPNAEAAEIPLLKKGELTRKVSVGINIEFECKSTQCKQTNKKFIKNIGVGMFDLLDSQKPYCPVCKQNQFLQYSQIALFQCRFAFSGMQDFKKKAAVKWGVAHQPLSLRKLEQKEIIQKPGYVQIPWSQFLTGWSRFKLFAKRLDIQSINDENEELLGTLQMEEASSHKICGVCKQNVADHMQHTLECGHSYHKICISLLPALFAELKCPLCK